MLIVLTTMALAQFVAWPLLLWLAAKIVRVRGVGIARAYAVFGLLFLLALANFTVLLLFDPPGLIPVVVFCCLVPTSVWIVKIVFRTKWLRTLGCLALTLVANVALAFGIRAVAVEVFIIPGDSMAPTVVYGERLFADKVTLRFRQPRRGEVVVFHPPHKLETTYIKRVIGVEGDRLELSGDELLVNGAPAGKGSVGYIPPQENLQPMEFPAIVPPGKLFMLGDNRDGSLDSRYWGFADVRQVVGLAVMIYASVDPPPGLRTLKGEPPLSTRRNAKVRWERIGKAIK